MIVTAASGRLVVATRATSDMIAFLPALEGRRSWLKGGGLSLEDTPHNRSALKRVFGVCPEEPPQTQGGHKTSINGHTYARPPEPHQEEALGRLKGQTTFALFMEQGTGKTKVGIDWACQLYCNGEIDAVLVISKLGVHRQWIEFELPKDCSVPSRSGYWAKKPIDAKLLERGSGELVWWSINWDGLKTKAGLEQAMKFCSTNRGRLLIIGDESQEIKNSRSLRHKAAMSLKPLSSHRMIATGTPLATSLLDEWGQFLWLDEAIIGCRYATTFKAKYCIMGGFEGRQIIGAKNMDDFRSRIEPFSFRKTKEQIGLLPKRYNEWAFDLTKEQRALMRNVKDDLMAEVEGHKIELSSAIAAFSKIQQIASGFILDTETGIAHRLMPVSKNPRAIAAMEWVMASDSKAIIWSSFREDKLILAEAMQLAKTSYCEYHSAIDQQGRVDSVRGFLSADGPQVLIAGKSANTGLNLQGLCRRALYYTNSYNAIDRWQSEDRIDRIGSTGASVYTDLVAAGSTDRAIRRNLMRKEGISRLSLGDIVSLISELEL